MDVKKNKRVRFAAGTRFDSGNGKTKSNGEKRSNGKKRVNGKSKGGYGQSRAEIMEEKNIHRPYIPIKSASGRNRMHGFRFKTKIGNYQKSIRVQLFPNSSNNGVAVLIKMGKQWFQANPRECEGYTILFPETPSQVMCSGRALYLLNCGMIFDIVECDWRYESAGCASV